MNRTIFSTQNRTDNHLSTIVFFGDITYVVCTPPSLTLDCSSFLPMVIQETYESASTQVHTLRRMIQEKDAAFQRHNNIEKRLLELEQQGTIRLRKQPDGDIAIEALGGGAAAGAPLRDLNSLTASMSGTGGPGVTSFAPIEAVSPAPPPPPPPPPAPPLPSEGTQRIARKNNRVKVCSAYEIHFITCHIYSLCNKLSKIFMGCSWRLKADFM